LGPWPIVDNRMLTLFWAGISSHISQTTGCSSSLGDKISVPHPRKEAHFFLLRHWDLNSGPSPWTTPPALSLWSVFWDRVSWNYLHGLSSNEPPALSLLSGWDYRREPLGPGTISFFFSKNQLSEPWGS
jgi:hypothetical protein